MPLGKIISDKCPYCASARSVDIAKQETLNIVIDAASQKGGVKVSLKEALRGKS